MSWISRFKLTPTRASTCMNAHTKPPNDARTCSMAGTKLETAVLVAIAATRGLDDNTVPCHSDNEGHQVALIKEKHHATAPGIDNRTAHTLDALATISVSARHEVFAVGAQIDLETLGRGRVILTIATNGEVSDATVTYHTNIWNTLRSLSKYYRNHQKANQKSTERTPIKSALNAKKDDLPKDYLELVYLVYQHCLPKWKQRLRKRYDKLRPYIVSLEERVADKKLDPKDKVFVKLYHVMKEIEHFHLTGMSQ